MQSQKHNLILKNLKNNLNLLSPGTKVRTQFQGRVSGSLNDGLLNTVAKFVYVNSPIIAPNTDLYSRCHDICLKKA